MKLDVNKRILLGIIIFMKLLSFETGNKEKLFLLATFGLNVVLCVTFLALQSYPTALVVLHIFSLLGLWGFVFYKTDLLYLARSRWKEVVCLVVLIALSCAVGLYKVETITPGIYGDEVTVGRKSLELLEKPGRPPFDGVYSHPTPLMYMTARSIHIFGRTKLALRLPSVVFGALAVGAFYILLRLFFPVKISVMGGLLFVFQYTHVVLERLAYEPPASLFAQILTAIFVTLYIKTKDRVFLIATALSLGLGLYTYLNFRAFAALAFVFSVVTIIKLQPKRYLQEIGVLCATLFVSIMPLVSYSIIDPHGFWLRSAEISIFSRGYVPSEFIKELAGNAYRILLFPLIGDPNPGKNPSGVPLFDPVVMLAAVVGVIYFFKKNRFLFWIVLIMLLPPFISDVFSTEVIPEFHYYGLGHPNALRVSGLIPVILFGATAGLMWIQDRWGKKSVVETNLWLGLVVTVICLWNYLLYFNQLTINPGFYSYNYVVNRQDHMDLIDYVKKSPAQKISMTKPIAEFEHVPFFLHGLKKVDSFDATSTESARLIIESSDLTAIDVTDQTGPIIEYLITAGDLKDISPMVPMIRDPITQAPTIVIFEKIYR